MNNWQWYVGFAAPDESGECARTPFAVLHPFKPTLFTYPEYKTIWGPFTTKRAAVYWAKVGYSPKPMVYLEAQARYVEQQGIVRRLWSKALRAEGIPEPASFVEFSDDNPIMPAYDRAIAKLQRLYHAGW